MRRSIRGASGIALALLALGLSITSCGRVEGGSKGGDHGGSSGRGTGGDGKQGSGGRSGGGAESGGGGALVDGGPPIGGSSFGGAPPAPPAACETDGDCATGELCLDDTGPGIGPWSDRVRVCRHACPCAEGEVCTQTNICRRTCERFQEPGTCATGEYCDDDPVLDVAVCRVGGTIPQGESCETGVCAAGLRCRPPGLGTLGGWYCEPLCDPELAPDETCPSGATCRLDSGNVWGCDRTCTPFTGDGECPTGETCFPFDDVRALPFSRIIDGRCVKAGTLSEGDYCADRSECGPGLVCDTRPQINGGLVCRRYCNPLAASSCNAGEECTPFDQFGPQGVGTCNVVCDPTASDPRQAGCPAGQWCAAPELTTEPGRCTAEYRGVPVGGGCKEEGQCASGLFCHCPQGSISNNDRPRCSGMGQCSVPCHEGRACPAGSECIGNACQEPCDLDAHVGCSNPTNVCVASELSWDGQDMCRPPAEGNACAEGAPAYCGPLSMCLDVDAPCQPVCRADVAPIGTSPHPDCPVDAPTCAEAVESFARPIGVCR